MWKVFFIGFATFPFLAFSMEQEGGCLSLKYGPLIAKFPGQLPETKCTESLFLFQNLNIDRHLTVMQRTNSLCPLLWEIAPIRFVEVKRRFFKAVDSCWTSV